MKNVIVSTYCDWNNYGSIMQSLGLKRTLKSLGLESKIVMDHPAPPAQYIPSLKISGNMVLNMRNFYAYFKKDLIESKYKASNKFINDYVDILYYNNYETLKNNPPQADYYIAGSDQIWRPSSCHPVFFLDFVEDKSKRASYAASMGNTKIPDEKRQIFTDFVNSFEYISVREQDNAEAIASVSDKNVGVHIDPAYLLTKQEWQEFEKPYPIKKPYILLYALYWDKSYNKQLKKLHKKTGYDIVAICGGLSKIWANKKLFDVDPGQFIWLIDNAEAVISSSFHGVSFSIIFNKKLAAVVNPALPSRITNLFSSLCVENSNITDVCSTDTSFYTKTNEIIKNKKEEALKYLSKVCSDDE